MNTSTDAFGSALVSLSRSTIAEALGIDVDAEIIPSWMRSPGASFVTLTIDGHLRGCIGSLIAYRPLVDDVRMNSLAAAFEDPRFFPLTIEEYDKILVEVSVLSVPETMPCSTREEVLASLRPDIDGVILTSRSGRAIVLPQVWMEYPTPEDFLTHVCTKAGIAPDYWGDDIGIERYHVTDYPEDPSQS